MNFKPLKNQLSKIKDFFQKLSDVQKKICLASVFFLTIFIVLSCILIATKNISAVHLECFEKKGSSSLVALNKNAQKGTVRNGEFAFFKFSDSQKKLFSSFYQEHESASLTVRIKINPKKNKEIFQNDSIKFGFLKKEDFSANSSDLKKNLQYKITKTPHPLIQANMYDAPKQFDLSLAVQKSSQKNLQNTIPEGFFITADYDCKIIATCIVPSEIGFDLKYEIPFYGFACNGGILDFSNKNIDFSGASMVFPVENSSNSSMPEFAITLINSENDENKSTLQNKVFINFTLGGEKFAINNVKTDSKIIIPSSSVKMPFSRLELTNNGEEIESFIMRATKSYPNEEGEVLIPVRTDPGFILNNDKTFWRTLDYEIFEWDRFERILFFDTRNYDVQDNFFRRLAYFVEKEGYKGRLLTNQQLQGKHGYNAHDYSSSSLANFFNKALEQDFQLNREEEILKKILVQNNLIYFDGEKFIPNDGGIVSISQESAPWLRTTLLSHEGWHTLFFKDAEFRNFVAAVYYTMDQASVDFIKNYFKSQPSLGYDTNDEYLMHNEFMAYLMQQKLSETANYFVHLANRGSVIKFIPELASYVRTTEGKTFEDAALALNDFVFDKYGIIGGNIAIVEKK